MGADGVATAAAADATTVIETQPDEECQDTEPSTSHGLGREPKLDNDDDNDDDDRVIAESELGDDSENETGNADGRENGSENASSEMAAVAETLQLDQG